MIPAFQCPSVPGAPKEFRNIMTKANALGKQDVSLTRLQGTCQVYANKFKHNKH